MNPTYGCHNKPRPVPDALIKVQDGWNYHPHGTTETRSPRIVTVPYVMSVPCQYDKRACDARCASCKHIGAPA